jgi:ABC-type Fe3+ transport system substrate-binding protein
MSGRNSVIVLLVLCFVCPMRGNAQTEQEKIEQAKKERVVNWYGSMNVEDAQAVVAAITKKYPFLQINRFRGNNGAVLNKMSAEARARALSVDVIDVDGFYVAQVMKGKYWADYRSPELKSYPSGLSDSAGLWSGFFLLPNVVIFNTNLVNPKDAPKSYNEMLDPKWKGRLAVSDVGVNWYHGMVQYLGAEKGRAYMKTLAKQNVLIAPGGNRNMVELTMAGEYPIAIGAFAHRVGQYQKKGAPMGWMKEDVIVVTPQAIGVSSFGKSPNAARLVVDYVLSNEGQTLLRTMGRIPAHPKVDADPPELTKGRKFFYSDIVDGGTRFNELNAEFREVFGIR